MVYHTIIIHRVTLYNSSISHTSTECVCPAFDVKNLREASVKTANKALRVKVHGLGSGGHRHINESLELVGSWTFLTAYDMDHGIFTSQNPLHNAILLIRLLLAQHQYPLVLTTPATTCHKKYPCLWSKLAFKEIFPIKYFHIQGIIFCFHYEGGRWKNPSKEVNCDVSGCQPESRISLVIWVSEHALGGLYSLH